jgi:hypothetical protein
MSRDKEVERYEDGQLRRWLRGHGHDEVLGTLELMKARAGAPHTHWTLVEFCQNFEKTLWEDYLASPKPTFGNNKQIERYMHCGQCIRELPTGTSPRDYSSVEVGWTVFGLQVWCKRHECNVLHVDFEGMQHLADETIAPEQIVDNHLPIVESSNPVVAQRDNKLRAWMQDHYPGQLISAEMSYASLQAGGNPKYQTWDLTDIVDDLFSAIYLEYSEGAS